jgi:fucose permease
MNNSREQQPSPNAQQAVRLLAPVALALSVLVGVVAGDLGLTVFMFAGFTFASCFAYAFMGRLRDISSVQLSAAQAKRIVAISGVACIVWLALVVAALDYRPRVGLLVASLAPPIVALGATLSISSRQPRS